MITTSRPGLWENLAPAPTGSSNSLATAFVSVERREADLNAIDRTARCISPCPDCGGMCFETATGYPHGVRWARVDGQSMKVDCIGRVVGGAA